MTLDRVVLDCSATMGWCFEDEISLLGDRVLDSLDTIEILVPSIWPLEVANVLAVAERQGRLGEADSARFLDLLASLPIVVEDMTLARAMAAVLSLARRTSLSSYDASYLELAMRTGASLATHDKAIRRAADSVGVALYGAA